MVPKIWTVFTVIECGAATAESSVSMLTPNAMVVVERMAVLRLSCSI